eukprot:UN01241
MAMVDLVAHNNNLQIIIKESYPGAYALFQYNAKGTVAVLKAFGVISAYKMTKQIGTDHTGQDNFKAWQDYRDAVLKYLANINGDNRLGPAREKMTQKIHDQHFKKFPLWPRVGLTQSALVNITEKGGHEYAQGAMYEFVAWTCEGDITVTDKRPSADAYYAEFQGNPTLKIIYVDLIQLKTFEKLAISDMDSAKTQVDFMTNKTLTWEMIKL